MIRLNIRFTCSSALLLMALTPFRFSQTITTADAVGVVSIRAPWFRGRR